MNGIPCRVVDHDCAKIRQVAAGCKGLGSLPRDRAEHLSRLAGDATVATSRPLDDHPRDAGSRQRVAVKRDERPTTARHRIDVKGARSVRYDIIHCAAAEAFAFFDFSGLARVP
jgi:hypothetical protein